jgi:amidase
VEPVAHSGRLERRRGRRDGGGALPGRAGKRRRRLDPQPRVVLRTRRREAVARAPVDDACAAAARSAAELLAELGHDVREETPPWDSGDLLVDFVRVWQVGPAVAGIDDLSLLEPINRALAEDAHATPSPVMTVAIQRLQQVARTVVAFWSDVDVVLTPTLALPPVPVGWTFEDTDGDPHAAFAKQIRFTPFTPLVNVTGQPALSLPLHWSDDELPIGVQLIGRPFAEATLLRLAAQLEQARPWADRRPPVA